MSEEVKRAIAEVIARPELRERCAKAALDAAWYDADGHGWVDPEKLPEGDLIEDWECEAIHWDYALDYWRNNGRRIADAVIAEMLP